MHLCDWDTKMSLNESFSLIHIFYFVVGFRNSVGVGCVFGFSLSWHFFHSNASHWTVHIEIFEFDYAAACVHSLAQIRSTYLHCIWRSLKWNDWIISETKNKTCSTQCNAHSSHSHHWMRRKPFSNFQLEHSSNCTDCKPFDWNGMWRFFAFTLFRLFFSK